MKRSEMIELISDYLYSTCGVQCTGDETKLLDLIEEAGMLPPKSLVTVCMKKTKVAGYSLLFEWEDEDE
jgi:hypothetical protein